MGYEIVTRAEWGAKPPKSRSKISTPVDYNWLHHTAGSEKGADGMRRIQNYHMSKGWYDIGYSWVYDPDNKIWFEGRGWGISGSHTSGYNQNSHGLCVMGNFQNEHLDDEDLDNIAKFVHAAGKAGRGPGRISGGHRDTKSTACPGNNLYNKIGEINRRIDLLNEKKEVTNNMSERYDTTSNRHFQEAYNWAVDNGIFSDATEPSDEVRAETLAVFLHRAYNKGVFNRAHSHDTAPSNDGPSIKEVVDELVKRLSNG